MPSHHSAEVPPISLGDSSALMPLQAVLALTHFHTLHPELSIDTTHPNAVDRVLRSEAMNLWLEGDEESLSARFREYADAHPTETISITDQDEIGHLFEALGAPLNPTVH